MIFLSKNLKDTVQIAANFVKTTLAKHDFGDKAAVVGLYGELGSGKTTFIKYLAEAFGIEEIIQSPTFVIMKKYQLRDTKRKALVKKNSRPASSAYKLLFHIDAYRMEKPEETLNLGWNNIISDPQNLICIEWPERIAKIMPEHIMVKFEHGKNKSERKISVA